MKIIGHRGALGYEPENTLRSFRRAIELGADMVELDVWTLPSGEVVIMHDHTVDRTTDGYDYLVKLSFEAVRSLDAGKGERVPTLEEALDVIDGEVPVNIELKGRSTAGAVAEIIERYMAEHGWKREDFLVSSFNHPELRAFKMLMPEIDIAALMDGVPLTYAAFAEELGCVAVNPGHEFVNEDYVTDAHRRGLKVLVWTVDDPDEVHRMMDLGVDGIFTNLPNLARMVAVAEGYERGRPLL
jgi:glycerophosphoryl diester phosphodiesterase